MSEELSDLVKLYSSSMTKEGIIEYLLEHGYTEEQVKYINLGIAIGVRL